QSKVLHCLNLCAIDLVLHTWNDLGILHLRLSSFLRDGNGIDALGTGVTTRATLGSGFGLRV
ncbi:hypothetical protein Tco_0539008, partial [Tanacetum coccineum]